MTEDTSATAGAMAHARYMVKNYLASNPETPHHEEPGNPWYTEEGARLAPKAEENEYFGHGVKLSPLVSVDGWMDAPLHRLGLLERGLTAAAFGHYCESDACAGTLVLESQARTDIDPLWSGELPEPVMFPANATTMPSNLLVLAVGEWPEPLRCRVRVVRDRLVIR